MALTWPSLALRCACVCFLIFYFFYFFFEWNAFEPGSILLPVGFLVRLRNRTWTCPPLPPTLPPQSGRRGEGWGVAACRAGGVRLRDCERDGRRAWIGSGCGGARNTPEQAPRERAGVGPRGKGAGDTGTPVVVRVVGGRLFWDAERGWGPGVRRVRRERLGSGRQRPWPGL